MMNSKLVLPPQIYFGQGSIRELTGILQRERARNVALFTDKGVEGHGLCESTLEICQKAGVAYKVFDEVKAEPSVADVKRVIDEAMDFSADLIIAVGGGSTMDTAKLASVLIGAEYTIFDLLNDPTLAAKRIRTVFVPTTCGTGSEATCNAIVAIPEENTKKGIVNDAMISDIVILDVDMIKNLPAPIVAATGVDALAHCVECYTGNKATPLSDLYAKAGAALIFHNIVPAYREPGNIEAKMNMLLGSFYGGVAITGSGTTAVHALSYPLGGKFHIAHGVSNAILFAQVMEFNQDACLGRLAGLCDAIEPSMFDKTETEKSKFIVDSIARIVRDTEIPVNLRQFGVSKEDLDFLVTAGSQQQRLLVNNPKVLGLEDIKSIYLSVL